MSRITTDRTDPRLTHGVDEAPVPQAEAYLVLSDEERAKGFVRPVRRSYLHTGTTPEMRGNVLIRASADGCGALTTMGLALCETYACDPKFYGATYCTGCRMHRPVGEFRWDVDGEVVGS